MNTTAIQSPIGSSMLIDIIRSTPFSEEEVNDIVTQAVHKEIRLMEQSPLGKSRFSWNVLFDPEMVNSQIHPHIPPNPNMAMHIQYKLRRFFSRLHDRILYPRASHKNMSYDTRRESRLDLDNVPIFGQDDWCRHYHDTGIQIPGICELRERWYTSQSKPRVYYAMGGTAYAKSRHIQEILLSLCDIFEPTNRFSKLYPQRLSADHDDSIMIYDFSSFTTNLEEMRYFFEHLARFANGITVQVWDERHGPQNMDLGDLFMDYSEHCVFYPDVSLERFEHRVTKHYKASMLGIYGNLTVATLCHYLAISLLFDTTSYVNVAGDDGIMNFSACMADPTSVLDDLGDIEWSKTYFVPGDDAPVCLKRPLIRGYDYLDLGQTIPALNSSLIKQLFNQSEDDPRFRQYHRYDSWEDKVSIAGKELLRFLNSATKIRSTLSEQDFIWMKQMYHAVRDMAGVPVNGSGLRSCGSAYTFPLFPDTFEDWVQIDNYYQYTFSVHYRDIVSFPVQESIPFHKDMLDSSSFICNLNPFLNQMRRLGYIDICERRQFYYHLEGYEEACRRIQTFKDRVPIVYDIVVLRNVPNVLIPK